MIIDTRGPARWLKAEDCITGDLTLHIKTVREEKIGKEQQYKYVVYFRNDARGFILNQTNIRAIVSMYGDDTDDWANKPITLYGTDVDFGGEMVAALRVRTPRNLVAGPGGRHQVEGAPRRQTFAEMRQALTASPAVANSAVKDDGDDCPF